MAAQTAQTSSEIGIDTQDEIEKIMSEIEELQQEMTNVAAPKSGPSLAQKAPEAPVTPIPPAPVTPSPPPPPPSLAPSAASSGPTEDAEVQDILKEFSGQGDEPWLEETLANLKPEAEDLSLGVEEPTPTPEGPAPVAEAPVQVISSPAPPSPSTHPGNLLPSGTEVGGVMSMSVKGKMTVRLEYEMDGQAIVIGFSDGFIQVQLSDGTEFKIPVSRQISKKAA